MNNKVIGNEKNIIFYNDEEGNTKIEVLLQDEDVWLNTEALAELFSIDRSGIVRHINNIYKDNELNENATCAKIAQVQKEGNREVARDVVYYNLQMISSLNINYLFFYVIGVIIGLILLVKLIEFILKNYSNAFYLVINGLVIASIYSIFTSFTFTFIFLILSTMLSYHILSSTN